MGSKFRNAVSAFLLSAVASTVAPAAQAETLADALVAAYRNSNILDQNRALLRANDENVAVAVAALRPTLEFAANVGYRNAQSQGLLGVTRSEGTFASLSLTSDLLIYDGGNGKMAVEAAHESVLAAREALIGVEQQIFLSTVSAYMDVRSSEENVALANSNVRVITQELRAAQDRFDVGEVTRTDVAIAEARLAASRANLAVAEGDLMVAREAYKAMTGHYPSRLSPPPAPPRAAASQADAQAVAVRNHPEIRKAQHDVRVAEINVARARAAMGPRVGLSASATLNKGGLDSTQIGLGLSQTLYQGGRPSALLRQAIALEAAERSGLAQMSVDVARATGDAWSQLVVAQAAIEASDRQIRAARTAYEGVREEAKLGARTTLDVLNAEQELLDAQTTRVSAEARRYVAVYALLSSMGVLTAEKLNLGIPTYDPEAYFNTVKTAPGHSKQGEKLDRILQSIGSN